MAVSCGQAIAGGGLVETNVFYEWRPSVVLAQPGETIDFGLYAVSEDGKSTESISATDVILVWDVDFMEFIQFIDNSPYDWFTTGFPNDSALDGLNNDLDDGDFIYSSFAQFFGGFAEATPEGLLVVTMRYTTGSLTLGTDIEVAATRGNFSQTAILSGDIPGLDIKGRLPTARIRVTTEPYPAGDSNEDGAIDLLDYGDFYACTLVTGEFPFECRFFDYDVDRDVDIMDYAQFQIDFSDQP